MVDDLSTSHSADGLGLEEIPSKRGLAAFASSTLGKVVLGGAALLIALGVIGGLLYTFVLAPVESDLQALAPEPGSVPAAGSVVPASSEESATVPQTKPLSSTFVFRDIFEPTVKPSVAPSSTADETGTAGTDTDGNGTSDTDTSEVPPNTLMLTSVSTVDGVPTATLVWNGQTYEVTEGESLGDTPWQVLDISGSTVVMLYGDTKVTLTVGQGVSK